MKNPLVWLVVGVVAFLGYKHFSKKSTDTNKPKTMQVQATDEFGSPLFDAEGNPVMIDVPVDEAMSETEQQTESEQTMGGGGSAGGSSNYQPTPQEVMGDTFGTQEYINNLTNSGFGMQPASWNMPDLVQVVKIPVSEAGMTWIKDPNISRTNATTATKPTTNTNIVVPEKMPNAGDVTLQKTPPVTTKPLIAKPALSKPTTKPAISKVNISAAPTISKTEKKVALQPIKSSFVGE